jgi:hypothetical protein
MFSVHISIYETKTAIYQIKTFAKYVRNIHVRKSLAHKLCRTFHFLVFLNNFFQFFLEIFKGKLKKTFLYFQVENIKNVLSTFRWCLFPKDTTLTPALRNKFIFCVPPVFH